MYLNRTWLFKTPYNSHSW